MIVAILAQQEHKYQAVTVPAGFRLSASRSAVTVALQDRQSGVDFPGRSAHPHAQISDRAGSNGISRSRWRVVMALERVRLEGLEAELVPGHGPALDVYRFPGSG